MLYKCFVFTVYFIFKDRCESLFYTIANLRESDDGFGFTWRDLNYKMSLESIQKWNVKCILEKTNLQTFYIFLYKRVNALAFCMKYADNTLDRVSVFGSV